jgi:hypothetical protein
MERRQENSSFLANDQRAGVLHSFFLSKLLHVWHTFEAMEAPYFRREKVLEFPGCRDLMDDIELVPEELVVEENLNNDKEVSVNEGVLEDNETIKTSNLPPPSAYKNPSKAIRRGPLTFNPLPPQEEGEDTQLATINDQTKLMRWH